MKKVGMALAVSLMIIALGALDGFALKLGGKELVLNGTGVRTKALLGTVYYLALYVPESLKGKDAKTIIEANEPMAMILTIDSRLLTRERFLEATIEGFKKAAESGYSSPKKQAFIDQFKSINFTKGDIIRFYYTPGALTSEFKVKATGETKTVGTIAGIDIKKALFAIWLGPNPVQASLKESLLKGK